MAAYEEAMKDDADSTPITTQPGLSEEPGATTEESKSPIDSNASNSTSSTAIPLPSS